MTSPKLAAVSLCMRSSRIAALFLLCFIPKGATSARHLLYVPCPSSGHGRCLAFCCDRFKQASLPYPGLSIRDLNSTEAHRQPGANCAMRVGQLLALCLVTDGDSVPMPMLLAHTMWCWALDGAAPVLKLTLGNGLKMRHDCTPVCMVRSRRSHTCTSARFAQPSVACLQGPSPQPSPSFGTSPIHCLPTPRHTGVPGQAKSTWLVPPGEIRTSSLIPALPVLGWTKPPAGGANHCQKATEARRPGLADHHHIVSGLVAISGL
jgi:hypothetical protein